MEKLRALTERAEELAAPNGGKRALVKKLENRQKQVLSKLEAIKDRVQRLQGSAPVASGKTSANPCRSACRDVAALRRKQNDVRQRLGRIYDSVRTIDVQRNGSRGLAEYQERVLAKLRGLQPQVRLLKAGWPHRECAEHLRSRQIALLAKFGIIRQQLAQVKGAPVTITPRVGPIPIVRGVVPKEAPHAPIPVVTTGTGGSLISHKQKGHNAPKRGRNNKRGKNIKRQRGRNNESKKVLINSGVRAASG